MPAHRPLMDRFHEKWAEDADTGCWVWTGCRGEGYGKIGLRGRMLYAHRVAFEHFVGPVPAGKEIDHLCRNRACCNPAHLEAVTRKVNVERGDGRRRTHCIHGHAYDEANTYVHPRTGDRWCRTCRREKMRRYTAQRKREAA